MRTGSVLFIVVLVATFAAACSGSTPGPATSPIVSQIPLVDGERYIYALVDIEGESIGLTLELSTRLEGTRYVLTQRFEGGEEEGRAPGTDEINLTVDAATFAPFAAQREVVQENDDGASELDRYEWSYADDGEGGVMLTSTLDRDGDVETRESDLRDNAYDNESSLWLWRTVDFSEELDLNYVSVNPIERTQQTVNIQTPAIETIEVPAGSFEVWRLIVRNGRAIRSAWINTQAPHQLVQWDNGDVIYRLETSDVPLNGG
jgi:hypothetical protein